MARHPVCLPPSPSSPAFHVDHFVRLDPNIDLSAKVDTEADRVQFIRSAAQHLVLDIRPSERMFVAECFVCCAILFPGGQSKLAIEHQKVVLSGWTCRSGAAEGCDDVVSGITDGGNGSSGRRGDEREPDSIEAERIPEVSSTGIRNYFTWSKSL